MANIGLIINCWTNYFKDKLNNLDPKVKQLSEFRLEICLECPIRSGGYCDPAKTGVHIETNQKSRGCGCHLGAKTMAVDSECPLGKW